ncbi:hypothetical protein CC86DRAFT_351653 [Ophiobolus disseminans]|uniref:CENP-V/GFA domain-containing protein n=1 Tax=Ophiobolus disseminans TaxID=1469910 RepID=A0A6A6ZZF4_9PLEO|nr:hypothetical protein CC86DRAFT_351653 [Ophiobolus disseminans]
MAEGHCNCASISVSIPELPERSAVCYCSNCRRAGSSVGSFLYIIDKADVNITDPKGNLKSYDDADTKSGHHIIRQFCGNCGCPIASLISEDAPQIFLKAGLFDKISPPSHKSFEHEEPSWLKIAK